MEDEDEESVESVEGKMTLTLPPDALDWKGKKPIPPPGLRRTEVRADATNSKPTTEEVEELQAAVVDLYTYLVEVSDMAREDSSAVLDHLSTSIQEVVDAIDRVNIRGNHLRDLIGDSGPSAMTAAIPRSRWLGRFKTSVPTSHPGD
jgi:hypothetical protein